MTFNKFIEEAAKTANYPRESARDYLELGIHGEAGEVCDKFKKLIRDCGWTPGNDIPEERRQSIALELGDVMWYVAMIAKETRNTDLGERDLDYFYPIVPSMPIENVIYLSKLANDTSLRGGVDVNSILGVISGIAAYLRYSLNDIALMNNLKLASRKERNAISGSGDYR